MWEVSGFVLLLYVHGLVSLQRHDTCGFVHRTWNLGSFEAGYPEQHASRAILCACLWPDWEQTQVWSGYCSAWLCAIGSVKSAWWQQFKELVEWVCRVPTDAGGLSSSAQRREGWGSNQLASQWMWSCVFVWTQAEMSTCTLNIVKVKSW